MHTKKKYFGKILSLLMAVMLIAGMLPTMAFASGWPGTPFANIDLSGVNTGAGNEAGWAKVENLRTLFAVDRQYFLDENGTPIIDENKEGKTITLQAGKTYSLYIEWGSPLDRNGDLDEMFNITGGTLEEADALVADDEGFTMAMKYTFTVKADKQPIGAVTLDGSSIVPVAGEAPKFLTIPEDALYRLSDQHWGIEGAESEDDLFNVDTFEAGKTYYYHITLCVNYGYNGYLDENVCVSVNGVNWESTRASEPGYFEDGMFYFSGVYTIPEVSNPDSNKQPIGNVELDGSSLVPIIGEAPKFLTAPENAPYIIKNQVWSVVTGPDTSRGMNEGEVFEADNDHQFGYDYSIELQPKDGYYFTGDSTLTVTGVNWDYSGYDLYTPSLCFSGCCSAIEAKTDPVKQAIGSVSLDGSAIVPVAGETPKFLTVPENASYSIAYQGWQLITGPDTTLPISKDDFFEAGKFYQYGIELVPVEENYFAGDCIVTVPGVEQDSKDYEIHNYQSSLDYRAFFTVSDEEPTPELVLVAFYQGSDFVDDTFTVVIYADQFPIGEEYTLPSYSSTLEMGKNLGMGTSTDYSVKNEFMGWNTSNDGSGVTYQPGDTVIFENSVRLYAQWKEKVVPSEPTEPPAPVEYKIIDGNDQNVSVNDGKDASFRSNAEISKFVEVQVDGAVVAPQNYTVTEGSTIVTFKADYLKSLSTGKHTVTIVSTDGKASTDFTVTKNQNMDQDKVNGDTNSTDKTQSNTSTGPKTGDTSNVVLWFFLIGASALGVVTFIRKAKKGYSK